MPANYSRLLARFTQPLLTVALLVSASCTMAQEASAPVASNQAPSQAWPQFKNGTLSIQLADWLINPVPDDFLAHATVTIKRLAPQAYSITFRYPQTIPMPSLGGVNLSDFTYYTMCLNSRLAHQDNKTYFSYAGKNQAGTGHTYGKKTLTSYVLTYNKNDDPSKISRQAKLLWKHSPYDYNDEFMQKIPEICKTFLKPEFIWPIKGNQPSVQLNK